MVAFNRDDASDSALIETLWGAFERCRAAEPRAFGRVEAWIGALMEEIQEQAREIERLEARVRAAEGRRRP